MSTTANSSTAIVSPDASQIAPDASPLQSDAIPIEPGGNAPPPEPAPPKPCKHDVRCPHCNGRLVGKMPDMMQQRVWGVVTIQGHVKFEPSPNDHWPKSHVFAHGLPYKAALQLAAELNAQPRKKTTSFKVIRTGVNAKSHGVVKLNRRAGHSSRVDLKHLTFAEARHRAREFNSERLATGPTSLWSFVLAPEPIGLDASEGGAA